MPLHLIRPGEEKGWLATEPCFIPEIQAKHETIFTQGNGYLGQRAALDESYIGQTRNLLVSGTFDRFHESDVRSTGRQSMGVIGMNLADRDEVVGMQLDTQGEYLLIASEMGIGERTKMSEFSPQNRGGKGVKCYKITEKTGYIVGIKAVNDVNEIMIITTEGIIIRIKVDSISILGRVASGVKLINMEEDVTIASIARVREDVKEEDIEE